MSVMAYQLILRGGLLFLVGVFFSFVLNLLQVQRKVVLFDSGTLDSLFSSAWWVPPSCGTAAGMETFKVIIVISHRQKFQAHQHD